MANDIFFGTVELDDLKIGTSQVDKVYLGTDLVYPVVGTGVLTVSINNAGLIKSTADGNYAAIQRSTSGTGSGATFTVTIGTGIVTAVASIDTVGTGYAVNDTITLDLTAVSDPNEQTYVVLNVLTLL